MFVDKHIMIVGSTGSGKSTLAIELARKVGAEVASVDAFQIYRGLDIGTGKVMGEERQGILHHLLDLVGAEEEFSVVDYVNAAGEVAGKTDLPLIWAGGTGLYVSALLQGLTPAPPTPKEVQDRLNKRSLESLQEEVRRVDPVWTERADLNNPRRLIRALGVYVATGRPMSEWQKVRSPGVLTGAKVFYLCPDPVELKKRINSRVTRMLESGWAEEVRHLSGLSGWEKSQSFRAIGYAEVFRFVQGKMSFQECREEICRRTWQYARRQRTWFRKQLGVIALTSPHPMRAVLAEWGAGK